MRLLQIALLGLCGLGAAHPALGFGNCLDPGYLDAFIDGTPPQYCDDDLYVTIPAATGSAMLRVIRLSSAARGPREDWMPQVEALAAAVLRAMDAIGTARLPPEISVLMTDVASDDFADTGLLPGGECRIAFYKGPAPVSAAEFTFTLAHEIFHCAQWVTWPHLTGRESALWWVEGSAEYFAHLAQPGTASSDAFIRSFDERSAIEPLTALAYENVVFFAWLAGRDGPPAVAAFLNRMRSGDQIAALSAAISAADWREFVETWLDGGVSLPGGSPVRPLPSFSGEGQFDSTLTLTIEANPFVIARWDLTFLEDRLFSLRLQGDLDRLQIAMRPFGSAEPWAPLPSAIDTCAGEKRFILYHSVTEARALATLDITTDAGPAGPACCLVGTWQPTAETLAGLATEGMDVGGAAVALAGGQLDCAHDSGDWRLDFGADHTGRITFDAHTTLCTLSTPDGSMNTTSVRSGQTAFSWAIRDEGNASTRYLDHDVTWTHTMTIGPMSHSTTAQDDGPSSVPSGFAYRCDADRLMVTGLYGLSRFEAHHLRVPPPE